MPGLLTPMKVLDFTTLLPGPFATMMLADLGADVLRIGSASRPDLTAMLPPLVGEPGVSAALAYLNRGKRHMSLNLKTQRAVQIVHRLVREYDVVVEQFRPGVMASLGLDYESLSRINPSIVYCSLTGYGQQGSLARRAGHDINYLSRAGVMSHSGRKDTGPCIMGIQVADLAGGSLHAVVGILAAWVHRMKTGEGQHVDVAMTDGSLALQPLAAAAFLVDHKNVGCEETLLNGGSLYDFYETKDGRYLSVGSLEPKFFEAFCRTIGRPDLIPGTVFPADVERIKAEVKTIFRSKTLQEWTALFEETDACVEPVLSLRETFNQPHVRERGLVVDVELASGGAVPQPAHPIKYSRTPPQYGKAGYSQETHNHEVLEALGYEEAEIREMERMGVFA